MVRPTSDRRAAKIPSFKLVEVRRREVESIGLGVGTTWVDAVSLDVDVISVLK